MSLHIPSHSEESALLGSLQKTPLRDIIRVTTLAISMGLTNAYANSNDDAAAIASLAQALVAPVKGETMPPIKPIDSYNSVLLPTGSRINNKLVPESITLFYTLAINFYPLAIDTKKIHGVQVNIAPWMGLVIPGDTRNIEKKQILFKFLADTIKNDPKLNTLKTIYITTPKIPGFPILKKINGIAIDQAYNEMLDPNILSITISDVPVLDNAMVQQIRTSIKQGKNETNGRYQGFLAGLILSILVGYALNKYRVIISNIISGKTQNDEEAKAPVGATREITKHNTNPETSTVKNIIRNQPTKPKDVQEVKRPPNNHIDTKVSTHGDTSSNKIITYRTAIQKTEVERVSQMITSYGLTVTPNNLEDDYNGTKIQHNLIQLTCFYQTLTKIKKLKIKITETGEILMKPDIENRLKECKPMTFVTLSAAIKKFLNDDTNTKDNPPKQGL